MTALADVDAAVALALRRGWITPAAVHAPGLTAWDASRSHEVVVIAVGHDGVVVKRHARPGDDGVQGSRDRDLLAHRLASDEPSLRGLAPPLLADEDDLLVVGRVEGVDLATLRRDRSDDRTATLAAVATALGRWHAGARRRSADHPAVRPWVLDALADRRPAFLVSNRGAAALLERVGGRVRPLLGALDAAWTPTTVIHGDLRADNVMVTADGVVFIDWETAGRGDPAWDVGALLAEVLTDARVREVGPRLTPRVRAELAAVLDPWLAAAGATGPDLPRRIGLACGARLLLRALQVAGASPEERPEEDRLVALALDLAARPEQLPALVRSAP